jgi:class 3 adenylate cyclase/tetratricopeptide (TPR) repeat protein
MKFCGQCTAPLAQVCPKCGFENPPGFRFCGQCTTALGSGSAQPLPSNPIRIPETDGPAALDGERKTVTALFADIKGSMELMQDLDPEEARAIVDPALKLMIDAVHQYDGYVVQSTGDGIFALFGAPVAYEDHPQRALYASLRMQEAMRRYSAKLRQAGQLPIEARVGVNTGEVVVRSIATGGGHAEYTPIGHSTNLAARMQALAPTGSIAATDITRRLCEGYFTFRSLGPTVVKGVSEPVEVFEVAGMGPLHTRLQRAAARGLTRFVGRQREMEALKHAAELAQTGHGQIVAVMAEPGVGKSRLFHEFKLVSESEWMTLEAFSVSHGKASAYLPLLELLRDYFRILPEDDARTRREKVAGKVVILDQALEDTLPYLYALLGIIEGDDPLAQMDPQIRGRRTRDTIKRILLRESLNRPLAVIFEDLHWIDGETQSLLNLLVDSIATARILLLVNYRPEYRHEWGSRTLYTQLRLDPLGHQSAEVMLDSLLGEAPELAPLKRLVVERTEGNPFFMEEAVQALLDEGALVRNGEIKLSRPLAELKIPPTVQAVLAARIDRLPAVEKELLQTLAVIGKDLALNVIEAVASQSEERLEPMLTDLQLAEFIYEQPSLGGTEYTFKHALTQEVAYHSLLAERRRALHEQTACAIEMLYSHQLEDRCSSFFRHYSLAHQPVKALRYAQMTAEQTLNRGAYSEAASTVENGLKLINELAEDRERLGAELALRSIESAVALVLHGTASLERERAVRRWCELGEKLGGGEHSLQGLIALCNILWNRGESARGLELAQRCISLAEETARADLLAPAHWQAGLLAHRSGKLKEALSHMQHARGASSIPVASCGMLPGTSVAEALSLQLLGRIGEAANLTEEMLGRARESGDLFSLALALIHAAVLCLLRRQPEAALSHAHEAMVLSENNGFAYWRMQAQSIHGAALTELGQLDRAVAELQETIAVIEARGGPVRQSWIAHLARCYSMMGRPDEAVRMLDEALAHGERSGEKLWQAETLRLKGEVLSVHRRTAAASAEACFRAALEVARAQEAKWWELRAAASLARLLLDTSRRDEARTMLANVDNWFTEGFELPDLNDAKALLDELSE